MKKFRIGISFFILVILCVVTKNIMLLFNYFVALVLHELAHLLVATHKGYKLQKMHLSMCGLYIKLDENIEDRDAFLINIAGPSFNLLLCVFCMSIFWLVPKSYVYLNGFCLANLVLALFNLIPVYPLDGGKIVKSMFKNKKHFLIFNSVNKYLISSIFALMFIYSCFHVINYFYIIMSVFFLTLRDSQNSTLSLFKFGVKRNIEKITLLKVKPTETLFNLLKQLKNGNYTIFYCKENKQKYIDEDSVVNLSIRYPLTTKIEDLKVE